MFRAVVASIVLMLALGQNPSLLCVVWCHPQGVPTATCGHETETSPLSIRTNDNCSDIGPHVTAFVREDVRRGLSTSQAQHALVVTPFELLPPLWRSAPQHAAEAHPPLDTGPLTFVLRI